MIVIIGPTASGKTTLATRLAFEINGAIISGDSRQVYQGMDIGTGKDLKEYEVDGIPIPYYLIDIVKAGVRYTVNDFQKDFRLAYDNIIKQNQTPVLTGGSGLYIEAVLRDYQFTRVPVNHALRREISDLPLEKLKSLLLQRNIYSHNFDQSTRKKLIRAIEICTYKSASLSNEKEETLDYSLIGLSVPRDKLVNRIQARLTDRLKNGMIEEVENLIATGITHEQLRYYGLEYTGKLSVARYRGSAPAVRSFASGLRAPQASPRASRSC